MLNPTSFRFTQDIKNKIKWTAEIDGIKPVQLISQLIEEKFQKELKEQLKSIITGKSVNPIEELLELLKNNFISKEYVLYSMPLSPKMRGLVLEKLKEE
jgi:hypothetical protein